MRFRDRVDAGQKLSYHHLLLPFKDAHALVLGIPRGGVVVGYEIAKALCAELDVIVPRKLGAPGNPEFAIGAIMHDGTVTLNKDVITWLGVDDRYLEEEKVRQVKEIERRIVAYRGSREFPSLAGRVVILVDDGVATGATMIAAVRWAKKQGTSKTVVSVPVGALDSIERLKQEADDVFCLHAPRYFQAVGQFYEDFAQVDDDEVIALLKQAKRGHS